MPTQRQPVSGRDGNCSQIQPKSLGTIPSSLLPNSQGMDTRDITLDHSYTYVCTCAKDKGILEIFLNPLPKCLRLRALFIHVLCIFWRKCPSSIVALSVADMVCLKDLNEKALMASRRSNKTASSLEETGSYQMSILALVRRRVIKELYPPYHAQDVACRIPLVLMGHFLSSTPRFKRRSCIFDEVLMLHRSQAT